MIPTILPRTSEQWRYLFRSLPACTRIVALRAKTSLNYRFNTVALLCIVLLQVFILQKVWSALYHHTAVGLSLHSLLVYITLANLQAWIFQDQMFVSYLYGRIREGQIVFDLMRPVRFIPQMCAQLCGGGLSTLGMTVLALPLIAVVGTLDGPVSVGALGLYVISLVSGYIITSLITVMVGMVAFWTTEIAGISTMYHLVSQFLSGALIPLTFFPGFLRTATDFLPFQATAYTPAAIYIGQLTGSSAWRAISIQIVWIALLAACACVLWSRASRRITVQGG